MNYTGGIHIIEKYIRSSTLLEAMVSNKVPTSFDALEIDIDSIDFSILETIVDSTSRIFTETCYG